MAHLCGALTEGTGGSECDYDDPGNLLPDPAQTFNFKPNEWNPSHWWDDFGAHFWYGGAEGYEPIRRRRVEEKGVQVTA